MNNNTEIYDFDIIIIGAGIIGLAIANELSNIYENILLIEKESSFGSHVSSRNSEVIHSGIYYDSNSLKAKLCIEGNKLLYEFAKKFKINFNNCGKIIIAQNDEEMKKLHALMQNGFENGLEGLTLLNKREIKNREPLIKCYGGLWIPSSGIINSHGIMHRLEYLIKSKDNTVVYNTEVINIEQNLDSYVLSFNEMNYKAKSKIVINASGLWCDKIAQMVGINDYKINFCKGEYYKTSLFRGKINSLIYPLPTKISLGIHIVLHLDGTIGFGPNAYYVNNIDYKIDDRHKQDFLQHINHYLDLDANDITEDFAGIRPKVQGEGEEIYDFIIKNESSKGYNNFINLIGIESPGLTSSLAIAKYVKNLIQK